MHRNAKATGLVALFLLAAVTWWQFDAGPSVPEVTHTGAVAAAESERDRQADTGAASSRTEARREPVEAGAAKTAAKTDAGTGSLLVQVVYGDDGAPAENIDIRVRKRRAETDAKGEVRMGGLRPGEVIVWNHRQITVDRGTIVAGEETTVKVTLKGGIDITVLVVDGTDVPVAGAMVVNAGPVATSPRVVGETDVDGCFLLRQAMRRSNIGARAKGYSPSLLHTIAAGAGTKVDVRIVLSGAGGSVRGEVLDPDGAAVADAVLHLGVVRPVATVITLPDGARGLRAPHVVVRTDADGRFRADGLQPGKTPVTARTQIFAPWQGSVDVVAHVDTPLIVRLTQGVVCEGTVRDENDQPAPGVVVAATPRSTRTASDGSYRLVGLPTGKIRLRVRDKDRGNASTELRGALGETLRWDAKLSRGIVLTGTVRGRDGEPLKGAIVQAARPLATGGPMWSGAIQSTKADGRFEMIDCPAGPVIRLLVWAKNYALLDRRELDATKGPLDLRLRWKGKATGRLVGRVVDPDDKPVGDAEIQLRRHGEGNSRSDTTTKASGEIDKGSLWPGVYTVHIRSRHFAAFVTPYRELADGETWDLGTVRMLHGGRLRVDVQLPKGREKDIFYLSVVRPDGIWLSVFDTRARPLLSEPIAPGPYELRVEGPGVVPRIQKFTIRGEQESRLSVAIRFGVAKDFEFSLPPGTNEIQGMEFVITDANGFRFDRKLTRSGPAPFSYKMGLVPGRYAIGASTAEGHEGALDFDVKEGASKTVRVHLR